MLADGKCDGVISKIPGSRAFGDLCIIHPLSTIGAHDASRGEGASLQNLAIMRDMLHPLADVVISHSS